MKQAAESSRGQGELGRGLERRLIGTEQQAEPRMRLLLFGCDADVARMMMIYSDRVKLTYLPSDDMEEVREEIERCNPQLVLCGAAVFLNTFPVAPPSGSSRSSQNRTHETAEAGNVSVARREVKILTMLAKGHTNDQIAKALRLSSRTVKRSLSSLFERLQVTNRTQLAGRVVELSLLEDKN